MTRLTAIYKVQLDVPLVIKRRDGDCPTFQATIEGFEVIISLTDQFMAGIRSKTERLMTHACHLLEVSVTQKESETPPPPVRTEKGGYDYGVQAAYFEFRRQPYAKAAAEALNRLFLFLRYRLHQPLLAEIVHWHQPLQNPKWVDETGADLGHGAFVFMSQEFPRRFGVIALQAKHDQRLNRALGRRLVPKLYEELLCDAHEAALHGNMRRAVLELAIACEVAVKQKFFGGSSGGRTLEYLEDKGRFQVPVVELIGNAAQDVFGETFKIAHNAEYVNIENLFNCRNKAAHRGRLIFRPQNSPVQCIVTAEVLNQWLSSARMLFVWLKKLRHQ